MTGPGSTWAAILAMLGEARVGPRTAPGPRRSPARSVCFSRSTLSPKREASSRAFKRATTIGSRTASSSAPRSTRRSRPFQIAPASRSAAARSSLSPAIGAESYGETVLSFGTVRGRVGYAPGDWLFYATGGFAWTYDRPMLTQLGNGATEVASCGDSAGRPEPASRSRSRRTGRRRLEYLLTDYGNSERHLSKRRAAVRRRFLPARVARRRELSVRHRCGAGDSTMARQRSAPPARIWSIFTARRRSSGKAIRRIRSPYDGLQQPARQRLGPRDLRRHALCRRAAVARRRSVDRSRRSTRVSASPTRTARPDFRAPKSFKIGSTLSVRPPAALFRPPDHRSRRRIREGGS